MRAASSENADDRGIRGATHSPLCVVANAQSRCRHVANRGGTSDLQSRVPIATLIGRFSSMRRACSNDTVRSSFSSTRV
jgi:hypothetical protein